MKPFDDSARKPTALMLAPEAPYPIAGGGPMRTASLVEYLGSHYTLDLIVFREPGQPDPAEQITPKLVRAVHTIGLPFHSRSPLSRAVRNLRRYWRHAPPLVDRFAGFEAQISSALKSRHYDLAVIEHFWCAPYAAALRPRAQRLILDLHNIESVLLERCSNSERLPRSAVLRRFAEATRDMERELLPRFDTLLATSDVDRDLLRSIAPRADVVVYPNSLPYHEKPDAVKTDSIIFSGNLEYEPNRSAIDWFARTIWPELKKRWPLLRWQIVGKNHARLAAQLRGDNRIEITGPIDDPIRVLASAKVAVVPLLAGSGTRIKIIEAWAAGLPVVSTSLGAEGLPGNDGEHWLIADQPPTFVEAVSQLLDSSALREQVGSKGRELYEESLTWPAMWQRLQAAGL